MATHILHLSKFGKLARTFTTTSVNTAQQFTTLKVDDKTSIATLTLNRPPANALNTGYMGEVQRVIQDLERTKCRGLMLISASDRIFCAGLDLNECYKPDAASLEVFWCSLQNLWRALFSTPLITVSLINGHAIAGGCMLALSSEYRVMLPNFKIGINETAIGLAVPLWLIDTYTNVVSSRRLAELDLTSSRIYSSDEALKVGLVDELATSKEQALERAVAFINSYEQHTLTVRSSTKRQFREEILRNFEKNRQHDVEIFMRTVQKPDVQSYLGEYLQSLKNKKRGKA